MNETKELYSEIYKNAELGKDILGKLIKSCKDASFRNVMADQFAAYHAIADEAGEKLGDMGEDAEGMGRMARKPIHMGLRINLAVDNTPSHMAEMLIQGGAMGLVDIARAINDAKGADEQAVAMAEKLKEASRKNIDQLLKFV